MCLVDIEITGEDDRLGLSHRADLLQYQRSTLFACHDATMVHVQVKKPEPLTAFLLLEVAPGAYPWECGVPSLVGIRRVFSQPEMSRIQQFKFIFLPENRRIFSLGLAVIAADTYVCIVGETTQQVSQLAMQHLLCAPDVEVVVLHEITDYGQPLLPAIALLSVITVFVADIVGSYL